MLVILAGLDAEAVGSVGYWDSEWHGEPIYEMGWECSRRSRAARSHLERRPSPWPTPAPIDARVLELTRDRPTIIFRPYTASSREAARTFAAEALIFDRELRVGAAIVASLQGAPRGLRVVSVAVHGRGIASVALNRKVERPVQVAWFVVSPTVSGSRTARSRAA